jgi:membrane associated rhomboid family serine protease
MIPIRSSLQPRNYPVINAALIIVNALVFFVEVSRGPLFEQFIIAYSLIPARYTIPEIAAQFNTTQQMLALVSFMFLHGGFWHLLGNMWFLYIFGGNVEDHLGHARYLIFYLACGLTSGFVHVLTNFTSTVPTIGASGAVAGVMGAYFLLYPRTKIVTMILLIFIPYFFEVPAVIFLGFWALMQFLGAAAAHGQISGIAWWAHVGGFVAGAAFIKLIDLIPAGRMTDRMRAATVKERSPLLHVARRPTLEEGAHRTVTISPREAARGTTKLVSAPALLGERLYRVAIPPGTENGTLMRMKGAEGARGGDVFLHIIIRPEPWD